MKKIALLLCLLAVIVISGCATNDSGSSGDRGGSSGSHSGCH